MSEQTEAFEAILSKWKNERIQPLGTRVMELEDRDLVIGERTEELIALCREHGTSAELADTADKFGGIEKFVGQLIQASDAQGTTLRPTAHDGGDD